MAVSYGVRGWTDLCLGRGDAAYADAVEFLKLVNKDSGSRPSMALVGYFGLRQAGKESAATAFIDEQARVIEAAPKWPYPIIKYLRREASAAELLSLAGDNDQMILARASLGMDLSLSGKRESALEHFNWIKNNGKKTAAEYALALSQLARLQAP